MKSIKKKQNNNNMYTEEKKKLNRNIYVKITCLIFHNPLYPCILLHINFIYTSFFLFSCRCCCIFIFVFIFKSPHIIFHSLSFSYFLLKNFLRGKTIFIYKKKFKLTSIHFLTFEKEYEKKNV